MSLLKIDWASHDACEFAVKNWHYSRSMPAGKTVKVGVWENEKFIGCVIFSMGAQIDLVKQYGLTPFEGCELTRIALSKHETPVSKIMSIAIRFLKKQCPGLKLIVSFADPHEGHHGGVYQATNWIYTGTSNACKFAIVNGKKTHPRTVSEWIKTGKIKSRSELRHKLFAGKHRYLFALNDDVLQKIKTLSKPYPKRRVVSKDNVAGEFHSSEGGAIPTTALQSLEQSL